MALEIKRKEGESSNSVMFRFNKRVRQSGILLEVRKRRFHHRKENKRKVRLSAIYRDAKKGEMARAKKLGTA